MNNKKFNHPLPPVYLEAKFTKSKKEPAEGERVKSCRFYSGATVSRYSWEKGPYELRFLTEPENFDLSRLDSGRAAVLVDHNPENQVGVIPAGSCKVGNGECLADLKFSNRPSVDELWQDIDDGIKSNLSMGVRILRVEIEEREGQPDLHTVTLCQPFEISVLSVGADAGAHILAADEAQECTFIKTTHSEDLNMTEAEKLAAKKAAEAAAAKLAADANPPATPVETMTQADVDAAAEAAVLADRERTASIQALAATHGIEGDAVQTLIDSQKPIGDVAQEILGMIDQRQTRSDITVGDPITSHETLSEVLAESIAARATDLVKPSDHAREYMGLGFIDLARVYLRDHGKQVDRMTPDEVVSLVMQSSSDFPYLLENAANKILEPTFLSVEPTYLRISAKRNFRNFQPHKFYKRGDFPQMEEVGEDGEYASGTINEGRESVTCTENGVVIGLTRKTMVDDNMDAFSDLAAAAGVSARLFENNFFWRIALSNAGLGPVMADGKTLFHADHGNMVSSGTVISVDNLDKGRAAMRKQTNISGNNMNCIAKHLVTGPDRLLKAEQVVGTIKPVETSKYNPFSGKLDPWDDAAITGNSWRLFGDPKITPVFIHGYLNGATGPKFATKEGWSKSGVQFKLTHDFGVGAIDHRAAYYNPGA